MIVPWSSEIQNTVTLASFTNCSAKGMKKIAIARGRGVEVNIMNARSWNSVNRRRMWRCSALILGSLATTPAWSACPKLLMTPGLNLWKQTSPEQAAYWGRNIGVQGFLVYYIAEDWQTDVGTNQNSTRWQAARQFQDTYSRF